VYRQLQIDDENEQDRKDEDIEAHSQIKDRQLLVRAPPHRCAKEDVRGVDEHRREEVRDYDVALCVVMLVMSVFLVMLVMSGREC
jgi:hypothetical protein